MNRPMEELGYKTHRYSECEIGGTECDECEKYYWEEVHADFCGETCTQRCEVGRCQGCTCQHCEAEDNIYDM